MKLNWTKQDSESAIKEGWELYETIGSVDGDIQIQANSEKLKAFFEANEFIVHLSEQENVICAEVEKWTDGGVDMIIWLNPFTKEEFNDYAKNFDVDDEVDFHRQDERYKKDFTLTQSLKDFKNFHKYLKKVAKLKV